MSLVRVTAALLAGAAVLVAIWALVQQDGGTFFPGEVLPEDVPPPAAGFRLEQNQPNPFQVSTVIIYRLPDEARVTLQVYNTLGAPVATLVDEVQPAGFHQVEWNGRDRNGNRLPGGIYFYQLHAGQRQELRRMVLLPEPTIAPEVPAPGAG